MLLAHNSERATVTDFPQRCPDWTTENNSCSRFVMEKDGCVGVDKMFKVVGKKDGKEKKGGYSQTHKRVIVKHGPNSKKITTIKRTITKKTRTKTSSSSKNGEKPVTEISVVTEEPKEEISVVTEVKVGDGDKKADGDGTNDNNDSNGTNEEPNDSNGSYDIETNISQEDEAYVEAHSREGQEVVDNEGQNYNDYSLLIKIIEYSRSKYKYLK